MDAVQNHNNNRLKAQSKEAIKGNAPVTKPEKKKEAHAIINIWGTIIAMFPFIMLTMNMGSPMGLGGEAPAWKYKRCSLIS